MKHTLILLSYASCLLPLAVPAALPQTWDVDLAAQPPQVFTLQRPRGETYELEAVLNVRGKPFEPAITNACIYWQTNGMANLYWSAPASVSNNVLRATWLPSMDPGATTVRGYIGDPGHIYAAAFQFRFIASPGPTPNVLPLPVPVIDFAMVRVLNPPWPTSTCTDTNAVIAIANDTIATNDTVKALVTATNDLTSSVSAAQSAASAASADAIQAGMKADAAQSAADAADAKADEAKQSASSASASVQQLAGQVGTIGAHLNAEDARFVSTNYNSATHMPEAYVEIKLPDNSWALIWREMTRWNWLLDDYLPQHYYSMEQIDAALDQKADRSWGYYDSHSGAYAPDGYTWISSPKVALAAGLGYQRTVTTEGAIWVLESNGLVTETGGVASNGFFRISDDEGNVHFEIVKGNKRTIGADASSCKVVAAFSPTKLQIGYSVVSDAHPTLRICSDLTTQQWKDEADPDCLANVTWEGQSGAWVAYVQGKTSKSSLFVKAAYEVGGESYIRNVAPVSMDFMYLGGVKFAVGTATISGHTVLTLTPAN